MQAGGSQVKPQTQRRLRTATEDAGLRDVNEACELDHVHSRVVAGNLVQYLQIWVCHN